MEVTVEYKSGKKTITVTVECQTATTNWAAECAKKVKEAVAAMQQVFPEDKEIRDGRTRR